MHLHNFDNDYLVQRHMNGLKLSRPKLDGKSTRRYLPAISIAELLKINCSIYFVDTKGIIKNSNKIHAECFGFHSIQSILGASTFDLTENDIAKMYLKNNNDAINAKKLKIIEEDVLIREGERLDKCVSIKSPIYDEDDHLIGIMGCSMIYNKHSIADVLSQVTDMGLLSQAHTTDTQASDNDFNLSNREKEILHYYIRGNTTYDIAEILSISARTVEQHIVNIKLKLNVRTRSELINLTFDRFK